MNPAQQAAKEYADNLLGPVRYKEMVNAFSAGYEAAEGLFAEWCSKSGWFYLSIPQMWRNKISRKTVTTAELYQLWQQSLQ